MEPRQAVLHGSVRFHHHLNAHQVLPSEAQARCFRRFCAGRNFYRPHRRSCRFCLNLTEEEKKPSGCYLSI